MNAELTDVRDNTEIWGQHYSGKSTEIVSLQQRIASDIAEKLSSKLSNSDKQQVAKQGTQNPEAYELYLKGRYSWNKRTTSDIATAISYFNQAISKDPNYALAFSGLADAYSVFASLWWHPYRMLSEVECRCPQGAGVGCYLGSSPCRSGQQRDELRLGFCWGRG